jgi:Dehydrogenases with different specificities (related to short-chain alcohol dehydrogenases)
MTTKFRNVEGKIAIVTGGARGIGREIAETLAIEGIHVIIADKLPIVSETYEAIKKDNPGNKGYAVELDVSDEQAIKALVEGVVAKLGRLDIICNNAGMHSGPSNVAEMDTEKLDKIMAVNFKGVFYGCKYAAQQMIKQNNGTIINIGSFFGKVGHAGSAIYGASKGAIHTMTQALALELAPYNVNVNALCPGLAASEMHWMFVQSDANARGITFDKMKEIELKEIPLHRYGYGKDYAGAIMWLASESGEYCTGQLININGGLDFT